MTGSASGHDGACGRMARAVVALAARLVPEPRRAAWREEWEAELWHHLNENGGEQSGSRSVTALVRSLGAIPHAMWILGEEWNVDSMVQDVRFALRTLARRPGFTLVAVVTLSLGIGGNVAVFSVVDSVLLRPLPVENADRLFWMWGRVFNGEPTASVSPLDYEDFDTQVGSFEELAAFSAWTDRVVYRGGDRPVELNIRSVSHDLLGVLGMAPAVGRTFTEEETEGELAEVAMISHGLWGRMFGFDESIIGSTVGLGVETYTIVGVLPEGLTVPIDVDVWVPLTFGADWYRHSRASHFLRPLALLPEGVQADEAQRELTAVAERLEAAYPETNTEWYPILQDLRTVFVGSTRGALLVLLGAVALVLLVACANVASLLLARSVGRRGEIAVRAALGAPRGRVLRQLLTESLILSLTSGLIGVLVSIVGIRALVALQPFTVPGIEAASVDRSVLLFALVLSVAVGVLFGMAPALGLASGDVLTGLRHGGRSSIGGTGRLRSVLVGAEVAVSLVLLVSAGLLIRSFSELQAVDPGFDPEGVIAASVTLQEIETDEEILTTTDAMLGRMRSLPGVTSAGFTVGLPLDGSGGDTYVYAEGRPPTTLLDPANAALIRYVGVSYFETMRMVVSQGRAFDEMDAADAPARTIINEALATRLFPNGSPIGERLAVVFDSTLSLEIVGVVENVPQFALRAPAMEEFYIAHRQFPRRGGQLVARVAPGGPNVDQIREAVWEVAPNQPLTRMTEVASLVSTSIAPGRFQALLLGMFSALAVALAGIGIYGVLAETVSGRRRELGVRLAMGAQPASLVREVVGKGLRVALIGLVVGAVVAWGATRTLNSMLYGVTSRDPLTFVVASVFLLSVVLFSSWIPARRAARVDPVAALRAEA